MATPAAGDDFWHALAACESENGRTSANQFQFTPDTWAKVGTTATPEEASYEEQRAAAIRWAQMVDPGTSAGWPMCWHIAMSPSLNPGVVPPDLGHGIPPPYMPEVAPTVDVEPPPTARPAMPTRGEDVALTG